MKISIKRDFISHIKNEISNPEVILEIGSRDAIQSIQFSRLYKKAKIYAFECNPSSIAVCRKNASKYKNIEVVPFAVFNKKTKLSFYVVNRNKGASSIFKPNDRYIKMPNIKIRVDSIRIDEWAKENNIKNIDLVWIDLQGAEYEAFEGFGDLLKNVQAIYTEVELVELYHKQKLFENVKQLLYDNGFYLKKLIVNNNYWGNAIFLNKKLKRSC